MDLSFITRRRLNQLDKGIPNTVDELSITEIKQQRWNVLQEDLPLPLAIVKQSALLRNSHWMQHFLADTDAKLAPHGKTTMAPQLFQQQFNDGAWGITVATLQQLKVCRIAGIKRILLANQLIGKQAIHYVYTELAQNADFEFYCLVDSIAGVQQLAEIGKTYSRPLKVLIEVGYDNGRAGCRHLQQVLELAQMIEKVSQVVQLVGIEGFEGNIHGKDDADTEALVIDYLHLLIEAAKKVLPYVQTEQLILTAGGTAYYDLVKKIFASAKLSKPIFSLIRSGCYLLHDSHYYAQHFNLLKKRIKSEEKPIPVEHAVEVWSYVQSLPQANLAILNFGKRDASFDVAMPSPLFYYSPGKDQCPKTLSDAYKVLKLDDQHAFLSIPTNSVLSIGDMVACGISHPCTTFDKWKWLPLVNDEYTVVDGLLTYF